MHVIFVITIDLQKSACFAVSLLVTFVDWAKKNFNHSLPFLKYFISRFSVGTNHWWSMAYRGQMYSSKIGRIRALDGRKKNAICLCSLSW